MAQKKKKSKAGVIMGIVIAAIIIVAGVLYAVFSPGGIAAKKEIVIEVEDKDGNVLTYDVTTKAKYLKDALDDTEGLSYDGTETEYGLVLNTVNGLYADYAADGAYWSIYVDGEFGDYGVEEQPVKDGVTYRLAYTVSEE